MLKKSKSQFAIEFVVLLSFMFLIFLAFTAVITSKILEAKGNERQRIAEDIAILTKNEIELARSVSDGYRRTFNLPPKIGGNIYTVSIVDNRELAVTYLDKEFVIFLPDNVRGSTVNAGANTLRKENGIVFVNS